MRTSLIHRRRPRLYKEIIILALVVFFFILRYLDFFMTVNHTVPIEKEHNINNNNKNIISTINSNKRDYRIFVFTYARPEGLRVTLSSILDSDYSKAGDANIDLEVFVDYRKNENNITRETQSAIYQILKDVSWPYGRYKIHRRYINIGLRFSIMEAWEPTSDNEFAAFFEDDVIVSPYWFSWVTDALIHYNPISNNNNNNNNNKIEIDPRFIGISLFRPLRDELSSKDIIINNNNAPFLLQQPCSWGALYFPKPWREFRQFFDEMKYLDVRIKRGESKKNPTSNSWSYTSSWKKYLIYYMYQQGWYMMYPNFPNRLVLSTSRLLPGEHRTPSKKMFLLPIIQREDTLDEKVQESLLNFPNIKEMKVFDVMFNEVSGVDSLPTGSG